MNAQLAPIADSYEKWLLANAADLSQIYALMPWPRVSFAFWTRERFEASCDDKARARLTHSDPALCWKCSQLTPFAELACTHCGYLNPNRDLAGAIAQQDEDDRRERRLSIEQLFPDGNPLTTTGLLRALDVKPDPRRSTVHSCAHCRTFLIEIAPSDANWAGLYCDNIRCETYKGPDVATNRDGDSSYLKAHADIEHDGIFFRRQAG